MSDATNCNTRITYNGKVITLPYSSEKLHKAFNEYFEREYSKKLYGYNFIEKEVLTDQNGEYLVYDSDDGRFIKDTVACIPDTEGDPHHFNTDWVKRIDTKRDKSGGLTKLDLFKRHNLDKKFKILKTLEVYLGNVTRYVEINY